MMPPFGRTAILRVTRMPVGIAAAVLLAGCGGAGQVAAPTTGAGSPAAVGVALNVTGTEYSFSPTALKAVAGPTTIRFTNKGAVGHDFTIRELGVKLKAEPGKSAQVTITLSAGTYKTSCSVAGHSASGMQGTLAVS